MEMRIVVPAGGSVSSLAKRLASTYGIERISHGGDRSEVGVQVAGEGDRAVIAVLESVERWLDQVGLPSAEMWLGEHVYRLARWAPETGAGVRLAARTTPRATAPRPRGARRHPRYAVARRSTSGRHPWVSA